MLRAFSMALLGAGFVALTTLPAQAFEVGPVQVILQPRVIVAPERARPRVVVVQDEPRCEPVVERRVIVIHKHRRHWSDREYQREYFQGRDRDDRYGDRDDRDDDRDPRFERSSQREVVVIRR